MDEFKALYTFVPKPGEVALSRAYLGRAILGYSDWVRENCVIDIHGHLGIGHPYDMPTLGLAVLRTYPPWEMMSLGHANHGYDILRTCPPWNIMSLGHAHLSIGLP